jgi:hypothetical protein
MDAATRTAILVYPSTSERNGARDGAVDTTKGTIA